MSAIASDKEQKRKFSEEYFEEKSAGVSPLKQTGEGLLRDITIGVIGGGLASAILGRYSFVLGLGVAGYGHYSQNKMLSALGLGMMASGTFYALTGKDQNDKKSVGEKVTERVTAFQSEMKRKLWLDYFEKKKGKLQNQTNDETKQTHELNGMNSLDEEQLMRQQDERPEYFTSEITDSVNPADFPELDEKENSFLVKKVDQAIAKEMKFFLKNRQAIAAHLEKEQKPINKKQALSKPEPKQEAVQKDIEQNLESHIQQAQKKTEDKKISSKTKTNSYSEDEPEPQELIF